MSMKTTPRMPTLSKMRELDLGVADHLHVAADAGSSRERGVLRLSLGRSDDRTQRARREAADVVDAADEVALADRHAARIAAGDEADLGLSAQHERPPDAGSSSAANRPVADEVVLRDRVYWSANSPDSVLYQPLGREQAVVARVVRERRAHRRRDADREQVGDATPIGVGCDAPSSRRCRWSRRRDADVLELVGEEQRASSTTAGSPRSGCRRASGGRRT